MDEYFELPEVEAKLFNVYVNWLHFHKLKTRQSEFVAFEDSGREEDAEYVELAELYLLSDKLEDETFADCIADAFLAKIRERTTMPDSNSMLNLPGHFCINLIFDSFTPNLLTNLLTYVYVFEDSQANFDSIAPLVSPRFSTALVSNLIGFRGKIDTAAVDSADSCWFHWHDPSDNPCPVKQLSDVGKPNETRP